MNVIQLTPDELASLTAAAVAKALEGLLPWVLEVPAEMERHPPSRKAVNQARYRQRLKERGLSAAHASQKEEVHGVRDLRGRDEQALNQVTPITITAATQTATSAATPVTLASAMLAAGVETLATSATQTATAVTLEVVSDRAPLPPAPSHPLPPQTPLSPAHPHPPTPGSITRARGGGELGLFTADAGTITEATLTLGPSSAQLQAQHQTVNPGHGTCAVLAMAGPNAMSGKGPASITGTRSGSTGGRETPRGRRRIRRDRPGRQRRERPPRDPEVMRLPRCEKALRLAAIFKRPATTEWSANETKALRRTGKIEEEDLHVLEKYYAAHYPPEANRNLLRHDLVTLLENLRGEVDRARRWNLKNVPPAPGGAKRGFWAGTVLEGRVD